MKTGIEIDKLIGNYEHSEKKTAELWLAVSKEICAFCKVKENNKKIKLLLLLKWREFNWKEGTEKNLLGEKEIDRARERLNKIAERYYSLHLHLLYQMQALGYRISSEGACRGFACMFMQAGLVGEMERYKDRLEYLAQFTPDKLVEKIKKSESVDKEDLLGFFDGTFGYQTGFPNNKYFMRNVSRTANFFASQKLEKKGGLAKVTEFTGAYSIKELVKYFSSLKESFEDIKFPIVLSLGSGSHVISVLYENHTWVLGDANKPIYKIEDEKVLAGEIFSSYHAGRTVIFETEIYTCGDDRKTLQNVMSDWQETKEWKEIHKPTTEKIIYKNDKNNCTWLYLASKKGHIETVKELLSMKGINVNQGSKGGTPLAIASKYGHIEVVKALLLVPEIEINQASNKYTPLKIAIRRGHTEIANEIIIAIYKKQLVGEKALNFDGIHKELRDYIGVDSYMPRFFTNKSYTKEITKILYKIEEKKTVDSLETLLSELQKRIISTKQLKEKSSMALILAKLQYAIEHNVKKEVLQHKSDFTNKLF